MARRDKPRPLTQRGRLLWVDDDYGFVSLFASYLRDEGFDVVLASSVTEAKNTIEAGGVFDLAILDVMLPTGTLEGFLTLGEQEDVDAFGGHHSGIELARWIRNNHPELPFVGLSVRIDDEVAKWFSGYGLGFASKMELRNPDALLRFVERTLVSDPRSVLRTFIVHGRDEASKWALKNYLQNTLGLPEPTILHEQPSRGRTILEKFEEEAADVDFVFVLLTPDDITITGNPGNDERRRARQNVIFELGYFLGRLGRKHGRVILLHKGELEIPTDIAGLTYISIDRGIEAAGVEIEREIGARGSDDS